MFLTMLIIGKDILLVNTKKVRGKFWRVRGKNGMVRDFITNKAQLVTNQVKTAKGHVILACKTAEDISRI